MQCPLLDDPIQEIEVDQQISRLNAGKAAGPDGVPPGVFKLLPAIWIS